jgi:hypothetical protein
MVQWNTILLGMELSFSLSNYSISYNLIKSIGFWDKYADAIAEDMHTQLKAIYARNGDLYTQIIYTPFNQLNIQSGSYIDNLKHKFWQGVRHAQGLFESSYCVNKFSQQKVKTFRMWMVTFFVMDTVYYNSLVTPIFAILVNLQMNFMTVTPARRAHYEFLHGGIFNLILVTNVIVILRKGKWSILEGRRILGLPTDGTMGLNDSINNLQYFQGNHQTS